MREGVPNSDQVAVENTRRASACAGARTRSRRTSPRGIPFSVIGVMVGKQVGTYGGPDIEKASILLSAFPGAAAQLGSGGQEGRLHLGCGARGHRGREELQRVPSHPLCGECGDDARRRCGSGEPTGDLDTCTGRGILDLSRQLGLDGGATVLITHDVRLARSCSRMLELEDGRPLHDGTDLPVDEERLATAAE